MSDKHERFQALLGASEDSVWDVMRWLTEKGFSVRKEPTKVAPTVEERETYKDDADFEVCLPIEVKALSADFTCRRDWPFGNKFIVDSKNTFDEKLRKPWQYIYVNKAKTHYAVLNVRETMCHWYTEEKTCGNYADVGGLKSEFYIVDPHYVSWHARNK